MTSIDKKQLFEYLDTYLNNAEYQDSSKNGVQIDTSKNSISKIGYAVDATTYIFDKGKEQEVDLIITHHGIFWGYEEALVWVPYERVKRLIQADIALYACHLPLDAHSTVWNNIWLLKGFCHIFGLPEDEQIVETFWKYKGKDVGFWLRFSREIHISSLQTLFADTLGLQKKLYNFWNKTTIKSVCFVSWQWAKCTQEAQEKWYDVLVTGEAVHSEICRAKELGISLFLWGHYETEKIGPKLLAHHIEKEFWLEVVYLDEKY